MGNTTLSIAIPTYNRKEILIKGIDALLKEIDKIKNLTIEIIVADNCSTDGTRKSLLDLQEKIGQKQIKLIFNEENLGAEGNIYNLPKHCLGDYIWILGDDDIIKEGALSVVVEALKKSPDYIALNFVKIRMNGAAQKEYMPVIGECEICDIKSAIRNIPHFTFGFLSSWVARKDFFNCIDREEYFKFRDLGLSVMYDRYVGVSRYKKGLILRTPVFDSRTAESEYPASFSFIGWLVIGSVKLLMQLKLIGVLSESDVNAQKNQLLKKVVIRRLLYEKTTQEFRPNLVFNNLRKEFKEFYVFWVCCVPIIFAPCLGKVIKIIRGLSNAKIWK